MTAGAKQWVRRRAHDWCVQRHDPRRIPWSYWGYESHQDGLSLHGVRLESLAQQFGSPLHILNVPKLLGALDAFGQGSATLRPTVCCSVKTYPVPGMLAMLFAHGAQAEVISEHELWLVRSLGVPADRIIYNGPAKSDESLAWAVSSGIKVIHLNHREEMERVAAIARRLERTVRVGFRLTTPGVSGQFGLPMDDSTTSIVRDAMTDPWLHPVSLHAHRGTYMRSTADVANHVDPMLAFARQLRAAIDWHCQLLDVGGSLAVPTVVPLAGRADRLARTFGVPPDAPDPSWTLSPAAYSEWVCNRVSSFCTDHALQLPELVMEPGRALSADAQSLLSTVLELRADEPFSYAVTDVGTAVAPGACDEFHQMGVAHQQARPTSPENTVYRIVGPICHLGDVASLAWRLPVLARGDRLVMMDSGAYFISDGSSFSFGQPGVVAVFADGRAELLRRTETSQDMVHRDTWHPATRIAG